LTHDININRIKDELVLVARLYEEAVSEMVTARIQETELEYKLSNLKDTVEINLREYYAGNGLKKPSEESIKLEVRADQRVVNLSNQLLEASKQHTIAKFKVDVLARREGVVRSLSSMIKAELEAT